MGTPLLNMERERNRQANLKSKSNSKTWKPEDGDKNIIRVLMFKHKVTKEDVAAEFYEKKEIGTVANEWCYPFIVHYGLVEKNRKIPVRSTPQIMEAYYKLKNSKDKDDQKIASKFYPKKTYAMNIVDINAPEKGVQTYLATKTVREFIGDHVASEHYGEGVLGIKGRDWQIIYNKNTEDPKAKYKVLLLPEKASRAMNSKVEKMVVDMFDPAVNSEFAEAKDMEELSVPGEGGGFKDDLEGDKAPAEKEAAPSNGKGKGGIFDADDE